MALQFNNTSTENGFCQEIDTTCKSSPVTYTLKQKARRMNNAINIYFQNAMEWCGNWSVGNTNNSTDLAWATTPTNGQQDYSLDSDMIVLESVWFKPNGGEYVELTFTPNNLNTTTSGTPTSYTKSENSILFDVIPSGGTIKIFFRRSLTEFVSSDTDKTAGTPAIHDYYLACLASFPYLVENNLLTDAFTLRMQREEAACKKFYNNRGRDQRKNSGVKPLVEDNK